MVPMVADKGSLALPTISQPTPLALKVLAPPMSTPPIRRAGAVGTAGRLSAVMPPPMMPMGNAETLFDIQAAQPLAGIESLNSKPMPPSQSVPPAARTAQLDQELAAFRRAFDEQDAKRAERGAKKLRDQAAVLEQHSSEAKAEQTNHGPSAAARSIKGGTTPPISTDFVRSNGAKSSAEAKPKDASKPERSNVADNSVRSDALLTFAAERRKRRSAKWLQAHHQEANTKDNQKGANVRQPEPDRTARSKPWRPRLQGPER